MALAGCGHGDKVKSAAATPVAPTAATTPSKLQPTLSAATPGLGPRKRYQLALSLLTQGQEAQARAER